VCPAILDPEQAMTMACLSKHYELEAIGTPFGVRYATLRSAEGFSTMMPIVRSDPIAFFEI
jgi:hypothetical protein